MKVIKRILLGTINDNVFKRIGWLYISFFLIFNIFMLASYFLLPEGILKGKHPLINLLDTPPNLWASTIQMFTYNLIPAFLLMASSLIAQQSKLINGKYIPISYYAFWALILNFGVILGTWSFYSNKPAETLFQRIFHTFDIYHNSGLIEISAYILVVAVSYRFTLWYSDGKNIVSSRKIKEINLEKEEKVILFLAFLLLFTGALIESYWLLK